MSRPLIGAIALLGAVVYAVGSFDSATARAQAAADVALVVRAGENGSVRCFEVEALRQRIAHYSATSLTGASELRLELYVDAADSAELRVYRGPEQVARRRFDDLPASCADRRDAVALSIALALDGVIHELEPAREPNESFSELEAGTAASDSAAASPEASAAQPVADAVPQRERAPNKPEAAAKPAPSEEESDGEADRPEDSAQDATRARGARGNGLPVALHVGGRWLAEALPAPVWTGALGAELWFNRWIAIDASAIASTIGSSSLAGAHAQTRLTGGELLGCSAIRFGNFAAQGCLGAVAAACHAIGQGYLVRFPAATLLWLASTARLALRWPDASRVSVRLVLQGHVNMVRPELLVDGSSEQLSPSRLGAAAGLDMLVSLE